MDEGFKNLIEKAENGDVESMVMVGDCYNRGLHTEKDDNRAHIYYKMAADKGHASAVLMVAIDYLNGIGIPKNKKIGVKYLQSSADNGVAYAQYLLATLYRQGEIGIFFGGEQKAMKYYEMAARQGQAKSQLELADLIWNSKNSKYSLEDMLFWMVCAYLHNPKEAYEESEMARTKLNALIKSGLPEGKPRVDEVIDNVKKQYTIYLKNPF